MTHNTIPTNPHAKQSTGRDTDGSLSMDEALKTYSSASTGDDSGTDNISWTDSHRNPGSLPDMDRPGLADMHCHILPGIDDGSRSEQESLELIGMAYRQGFRTFIATPHYRRTRDNPDIETMTARLLKSAREIYPDIDIYPGQEGFWHEDYPERIHTGQARGLAGSDYILCEFDISAPYAQIVRGLHSISDTGRIPVLAHYERYASLRQDSRARDIKRMGVVMQMNYEALTQGGLLDGRRRWCRAQVTDGIVDALCTDMHRIDFRAPDTAKAANWLKKKISSDIYDKITRRNALHIIRNESIER